MYWRPYSLNRPSKLSQGRDTVFIVAVGKRRPCKHCCCSVAKSCQTLCNPMNCSMPGFPVLHISWSLLRFKSVEFVMPSNHLILGHLLLLLPSTFASNRVFSKELALQVAKVLELQLQHQTFNEYSGRISFGTDWCAFAIQRTLKSLLWHHSLNASVLQC